MTILSLLACAPYADPVAERWNVVFAVDAVAEDEGCEPASTAIEPDEPYVGIGFGRGAPDTVSVYWCPSEDECDVAPWATVWVDEATEKELVGQRGEVSITGDNLCLVGWNGLQGHIDGDRITLDVQLYSGTPVSVDDATECDALLQALIGTTCTATRSFEGTIPQ